MDYVYVYNIERGPNKKQAKKENSRKYTRTHVRAQTCDFLWKCMFLFTYERQNSKMQFQLLTLL